MHKLSLILVGLVGLTTFCAKAEPQAWQGQVGSAPIVMELDISSTGDDVIGRYFYRKYNADIPLIGKKTEDGKLHLAERPLRDEDKLEFNHIVLSPKGKGWQGKWQGPEAKKSLPVTLKPLDASMHATVKAKDPSWVSLPYDLAKRAGMRLKAGEKQNFMGYTLEWMEEPVTKIKMFRVRDGFSGGTLNRINAMLEERQWQEIYSYFACRVGNKSSFDFDQTVTPRFLSTRLLSVSIFTNYYCGGAHPEFIDNPLNLDIGSGKRLVLEDLLWLKSGEPQLSRNADGRREDFEYENRVLAPWLAKTMTGLYSHKMMPPHNEKDSCNYTDTEIWSLPIWYLTPKGIYVSPYFARVARNCEYPDWSILPWRIVNEHPGRLKGKLP